MLILKESEKNSRGQLSTNFCKKKKKTQITATTRASIVLDMQICKPRKKKECITYEHETIANRKINITKTHNPSHAQANSEKNKGRKSSYTKIIKKFNIC